MANWLMNCWTRVSSNSRKTEHLHNEGRLSIVHAREKRVVSQMNKAREEKRVNTGLISKVKFFTMDMNQWERQARDELCILGN